MFNVTLADSNLSSGVAGLYIHSLFILGVWGFEV